MPCSKEGLWCTALDKALSADRGNTFPLLSTAEFKGQVWASWYETEMHGLPKQLRDCNISAMRKGWKKQECSAYSRKGSEVISRIHLNSCYEGTMQTLFTGAQLQDQRWWAQTETWDVTSEHQESLYCLLKWLSTGTGCQGGCSVI